MLSKYVEIKAGKNKALSEAVKGLEDGDKLADSPRLKKEKSIFNGIFVIRTKTYAV